MPGRRRAGPDPLAGVERVLVDGSNLAYALARETAGRDRAPKDDRGTGEREWSGTRPRPKIAVIAAVRAAFPPAVRVEVVFDGAGEVGIGRPGRFSRAASNLYVEHSGRQSADRVIESAVAAQLAADGPVGTWGILVVSDDRELRGLVQAKGARVAGTAWLAGRLDRFDRGSGGGRASGGRPGAGRGPGCGGGRSGTGIGNARPPRRPQAPRS